LKEEFLSDEEPKRVDKDDDDTRKSGGKRKTTLNSWNYFEKKK
jgi:hypothetical protein